MPNPSIKGRHSKRVVISASTVESTSIFAAIIVSIVTGIASRKRSFVSALIMITARKGRARQINAPERFAFPIVPIKEVVYLTPAS